MIKVAINGFGRIGRCILRALIESGRRDVVVSVVNVGSGDFGTHYHLLKYDSTHGTFDKFDVVDDGIVHMMGATKFIAEMNPEAIDWASLNVDVVLECTGMFTTRDKAAVHLKSGAKRVVVSAPCNDADATIIIGVNEGSIKDAHSVISIASCTTNCLAPLVNILNSKIGIESGFMTTVHAYTNDQMLLDTIHSDKRRARACAASMIPSSTGAAKSLGLVIPELEGKLDGIAIRVPTANVSMVDLKFKSSKDVSVKYINDIMKDASSNSNVIMYCDDELVSKDFNHSAYSCIFDATQTRVVSGDFCRVAAWYDNEWGFANRMIDVSAIIGAI